MTRTRKWSTATALVVVLVMLAGWFLLVSPKRASADDLRAQAAAQANTNDGLTAKIAELNSQRKDVPTQQAEIASIQQQIPQNPQLPALIRSLSAMANLTSVSIRALTPLPPLATTAVAPPNAVGANGETLQVVGFSLEIDGTYFNVERFLSKIEVLKRYLMVTGLTIDATGVTTPTAVGQSPILKAVLTVRAFMVSSAVAPGTSPLTSAATGTTTGTSSSTTATSSSTTAH